MGRAARVVGRGGRGGFRDIPIIAMQNKNISNLQRKHYTDMQANKIYGVPYLKALTGK